MHRVVIIGAGFGGLSAARSLARKPVDVTIIDQRNFHTFQPLLYEVSTAGLDPGDVAYPIRAIFGRVPNVTFRYGAVTGVDWGQHTVSMDEGEPIPFDSVIVASGATVKYFGIPGAEQYAHALYTLADARYLRDHILRRLEEVDADPKIVDEGALTFVVIGGGPTGVEVAGALAELLDVSVRHDGFRFDRSQARIILVDGLDRLLTPVRGRRQPLRRRHAGEPGRRAQAGPDGQGGHRRLRGPRRRHENPRAGRSFGPAASPSRAASLPRSTPPAGRTDAWSLQPDLSLPGHPEPSGSGMRRPSPGAPGTVDQKTGDQRICPQLAQVAIQSGKHAAAQIVNRVEGRPTRPSATATRASWPRSGGGPP